KAVKALVSPRLFAPLAGQQALRLQPSEQGIECAFVDRQPGLRHALPERVTVTLLAKRDEHREHQRSAAKLDAQLFENIVFDRHVSMSRIMYDAHCMSHGTVRCKVYSRRTGRGWHGLARSVSATPCKPL